MFDETKPLSEIECYRVADKPIKVRIEKKSDLFYGWFWSTCDIISAIEQMDEYNKKHGAGTHWLEWEV